MSRKLTDVLAFAVAVTASVTAPATTPVVRTLGEAAVSADWIVEAEVLSVATDPGSPFPGVWSRVDLRVLDQVGETDLPETITLDAPGGRVGSQVRMVIGAPYFVPGQRYILLLRDWNRERIVLEHIVQGAFRLRGSPPGEPFTPNDLDRRGLISDHSGAELSREELFQALREARER